MYCKFCGKESKKNDKFCVNCGKKIEETVEVAESQELGNKEELNVLPAVAKGFSWGFLTFPFFYAISMKSPWWFIIVALCLQILGRAPGYAALLYFVFAIPLAFYVREDAYRGKRVFQSDEEFANVQKIWNIWGIILLVLAFAVGFLNGLSGNV